MQIDKLRLLWLVFSMGRKTIWATLDPFFEDGAVLGRKAANTQFFHFLLRADPFDRYDLFLPDPESARSVEARLDQAGASSELCGRIRLRTRLELPEAVAREDFHCFHQSDCIVHPGPLAALRNACSRTIFPITSVTHSLSYANYQEAFLRLLSPSTSARDCLAATSRCALKAVEAFFRRLRQDFDLNEAAFPAPAVRRIPLGVDPEAMAPAAPEHRAALRQGLGLSPDACCLLVFGRIAHHSKMDMLPLLRAVQRLLNQGLARRSVHLLAAGWAEEDDEYPEQIAGLAANLGLGCTMLKRPTEARKIELFQAADIFVSIADNPQETFGLTVLEAQAAALPVVASDYDGYRDLVAPEDTGLLVETLGPHETRLIDLLAPLVYGNQHHLLLAQQTAVSVPALAGALERLILDPGLRASMGAAGRARVLERFGWPAVIARWVELWDELWRAEVDEPALRACRRPLALPYAEIFASHPSRVLAPETLVAATQTGRAVRRGAERPVVYAMLEPFLRLDALNKLIFLARKPVCAQEAVARLGALLPDMTDHEAWATLRWAVKQDLLETAAGP